MPYKDKVLDDFVIITQMFNIYITIIRLERSVFINLAVTCPTDSIKEK